MSEEVMARFRELLDDPVELEAKGWFVIIVLECQLKKARFEETGRAVSEELYNNGKNYREALEERKKPRKAYRQMRREQFEKEEVMIAELRNGLTRMSSSH